MISDIDEEMGYVSEREGGCQSVWALFVCSNACKRSL